MPVSKYRAAAADDVVTGNFCDLPVVVLTVVWGYAVVTAAARKNANIKRSNRIELPMRIEAQFAHLPQRDGGNPGQQTLVILLIPNDLRNLLGQASLHSRPSPERSQ